MDEMKLKLSTKFMRNIVAKLLSKLIRDKVGYDVSIELGEIEAKMADGNIHIHINEDAVISNDEFVKILKKANLD